MTDVLNPVDGSVVGQVEHHSESQVRPVIVRTSAAFIGWSRLLAKQRGDIVRLMFTRKVSIALAAGRAIIMKPMAETRRPHPKIQFHRTHRPAAFYLVSSQPCSG
jgi:acyl-CoA reductase-like NAD-dependent aldehyde dehydrogenase